jgi:hypothetical protein
MTEQQQQPTADQALGLIKQALDSSLQHGCFKDLETANSILQCLAIVANEIAKVKVLEGELFNNK